RYPTPEAGSRGDRDEGPTLNQAEQRVLSALAIAPDRRELGELGELAEALAQSSAEAAMLHASKCWTKRATAARPGSSGRCRKWPTSMTRLANW
ncbi:MAG: hypothetical protein ABIO17_05710, partial [Pseudoxanthomonas sp.]